MKLGALFHRDRKFRWRLLFSAWSGVILAVIAFAMLAESLVEERLLESARREVLTHTTYLASELCNEPSPSEIEAFEIRLRQVVSKSDATAIALYRNESGSKMMRRVAVQSDADSTLRHFPEQIARPLSLLTATVAKTDAGAEVHIITALTTERGRPIGAVRLASSLGHAGALITLLHGLIILIGLGFLIAAFILAKHFSNTVRRPIERISRRLDKLPCVTGEGPVLADEAHQLAALADRLGEIVTEFGDADTQRADIESLQSRLEERSRLLQDAYLDMDSLDRVKDTFLSNLSHEMRTPLTSILAAQEILSNFGDEDPETRKEFLDIIHQESNRLLDLIGKLLDLAKLEAKALQLHHETVDLGQLVDQLVDELHSQGAGQRVKLMVEHAAMPTTCECDRERIARVVHSMLECAVYYSPHGGEIGIRVGHESHQATITVTDEGTQSADRLTDMFETQTEDGDTTGKRPFVGYPIAQKLANMHGGSLEPLPNAGNGTIMALRLPRYQATDAATTPTMANAAG